MLRVGIVGLGYWGPNLARVFSQLPDTRLAALCDRDEARLARIHSQFPGVAAFPEAERLLDGDSLDIAAICTPARTHYALARMALERGLHTFVEKPLATTPQECAALVRLAERQGLVLFVGHTFLHTTAVAKLQELTAGGELGHICYISSTRLNLGPVRHDVSVLWDLAPHDVSIILHLMGRLPVRVQCQGLAYLDESVHDVCSLTLEFENRSMGFVQVSWLHPDKRRRVTVVGDRKMAVYDDGDAPEKVRIYDRGVVTEAHRDPRYSYRHGETRIPTLVDVEPLAQECRHFVQCVRERARPITDGRNGLAVVRVLHAAEASLHRRGEPRTLGEFPLLDAAPADGREAGLAAAGHTRGSNGGVRR
jgi:predicted dehydrogenase